MAKNSGNIIVRGFDKSNYAIMGDIDKKTEEKIKLLTGKPLRRKDTEYGSVLLIGNANKQVAELIKISGAEEYSSLADYKASLEVSEESEKPKKPKPAKKSAEKPKVKKDASITIIQDYTDKSFAVYGDTKPHLEKIKELKGRVGAWKRLAHGMGWVFPSSSRKVFDFLESVGAQVVTREDYESDHPARVVAKEPAKKRESDQPTKEPKVVAKTTKAKVIPVMDESGLKKDSDSKTPVRKFIKDRTAKLEALFDTILNRNVLFHDLKDYVSTFMTTKTHYDPYGVTAHLEIAKIRAKYLEPNVYVTGWDILLGEVLRSGYDSGDDSGFEKVIAWAKKYDQKNYVITKKTAKRATPAKVKKTTKSTTKAAPKVKKTTKSPVKRATPAKVKKTTKSTTKAAPKVKKTTKSPAKKPTAKKTAKSPVKKADPTKAKKATAKKTVKK